MKANTLRIVEAQLPQVFDRRRRPEIWPDGVTILRGDIVDPLNDTLETDLLDPNAGSTDDGGLEKNPESIARGRLRQVHDELSDFFRPSDLPGGLVWPRDDTFSRGFICSLKALRSSASN